MKTLEDIKQERAYEMDYSDWEEFIYSTDDPDILDMEFDEVAIRFSKEVARESLKNAAENACLIESIRNSAVYDTIDKYSILNEKNIPEI